MTNSIIANPDFTEPAFRFIAVEAMKALSPIAASESNDAASFADKQLDFLHRFGEYLVALNPSERFELFDLLCERCKVDAPDSQLELAL